MLRGGWEFQEGIAVDFLLVWCGRSATTLVAAGHNVLARAGWNLAILIQTKFKNRYGEAPRRWWPKAIFNQESLYELSH
ncbi:hypothetical protein CXF78_04205 [Shewanella sp. 11B5]|nr:hypothetical protein CXF78_04205 [Shewanella sp. 11B5]